MLLIVFGEGSVDELLWELALGALFFSDWSCGFVFGERLCIKSLLVGVFLGEDLADGSDLIATLLQIDDAHALRSTTLDGDITSVDTDRDTTLIDDHQVVLIGDGTDSYELTRLIGDVEGLDTLRATIRDTVVLYKRTLTIALFAYHEDGLLGILRYGDHTDDLITAVSIERHTAYTRGISAHSTDGRFVEADSATVAVRDEDFAIAIGQADTDQLVIVDEVDGDDPVGTRTRVRLEEGLLDRTALGAEDEVMRVHELSITRQVLHADEGIDAVACLDVEEVLQGTAP